MKELLHHILKKMTRNNELALVDLSNFELKCKLERKVGWAGYENSFS